MGNTEKMQQFEGLKVRTVWNEDEEKWYFSKERLLAEGNQTVTNCHQLKMTAADGKQRLQTSLRLR